ncbi:MAG: tRNA threonylcarbamoyladenosine dehydratase [Victivallales bacterium]|nr:tRNA threonylcarbamoyladenosine dehydratase [Victivallales bacterium]
MNGWNHRTALLLGEERLANLARRHVLVVGLGGVGGYAAEFLCRAGIGNLTVADGDVFAESNVNRQLGALRSTLGKGKAEVFAERLKDINPEARIRFLHEFVREDRTKELSGEGYDYVVDAIDILSHKVSLIACCLEKGVRIVSSMGAGGKVRPEEVRLADISESHNCRLAKMVRKRLHKRGIFKGLKVVFSPEGLGGGIIRPDKQKDTDDEDFTDVGAAVGTVSYMPPVFAAFCAAAVIQDIA